MMEPIDKYGNTVFKLRVTCTERAACPHQDHFVYIEDDISSGVEGVARLTPSQADAGRIRITKREQKQGF